MKRSILLLPILLGLLVVGCDTTDTAIQTGLEGLIERGPITPVCRVDVACYAPVSAGFTVFNTADDPVATFSSDEAGLFEVVLAPGVYTIVPDADAPIPQASSQSREVEVLDQNNYTTVQLRFDTFIR